MSILQCLYNNLHGYRGSGTFTYIQGLLYSFYRAMSFLWYIKGKNVSDEVDQYLSDKLKVKCIRQQCYKFLWYIKGKNISDNNATSFSDTLKVKMYQTVVTNQYQVLSTAGYGMKSDFYLLIRTNE